MEATPLQNSYINVLHKALMLVKSMFLTRVEKQYTYEILILLDLYQGRFPDTEENIGFKEFQEESVSIHRINKVL